jgi:hypothetical protein
MPVRIAVSCDENPELGFLGTEHPFHISKIIDPFVSVLTALSVGFRWFELRLLVRFVAR